MKIHELIEHLKREDPEMEIHLSKDPEGNGFHSLNDLGHHYVEKGKARTWDPDIWDEEGIEEMREEDGDDYIEANFEKVIVFWP